MGQTRRLMPDADTTASDEPGAANNPEQASLPDQPAMPEQTGMPDELPAPVMRVIAHPTVRAVLAGLLLAGSMPPWGWWPLAFAGIALLDRLLADTTWRQRLWRGSVVGWALFVPTVFWINQLTAPGYGIAVVFYGLLVGAFSIAVPPRAGRALGLVGAWVLCESLRSAWPFGGVPLSLLAVSQVAGPLAPIARVGGVLAVAGVTVAAGLAVSAAFGRHYRKAAIAGGSALAVLVLALVAPSGQNTGETLDIAFVQGGGDQGTRAINTDRRQVFERHLEASEEVPAGLDLVLWPENVVDTDGDVQDAKEGRELQALARWRASATPSSATRSRSSMPTATGAIATSRSSGFRSASSCRSAR
jgi:apolipoprotein N-acyltransferase